MNREYSENASGTNGATGAALSDREIHTLLGDADALDLSREEFESFDDSTFDVTGVDMPAGLSDHRHVLDRMDGPNGTAHVRSASVGATLFDHVQTGEQQTPRFDVSPTRFRELVPLVIQAYLDVRNDWSADYVILESEMDLRFLQRCWQLGAATSPEELNWTLMNARKDGKMSGLPRARSFSIPKNTLDEFSFAAEIAVRQVQDRLYEEHKKDVSLDKLLCSPRLASDFDRVARQITPGYSCLQYRWAAMTLRKARRLPRRPMEVPLFADICRFEDVVLSRLPTTAGLYWLAFENCSAFVAVARNLRAQVDALRGCLGAQIMPDWIPDRPRGSAVLRVLEMQSGTLDDRELVRSAVIRNCGSRLNFRSDGLFQMRGQAAVA